MVWYTWVMAKARRIGPNLLTRAITEATETDSTKTELARGLGMTVEQLRHIEAGRRRPTLDQAVALEDELEIPIRAWL